MAGTQAEKAVLLVIAIATSFFSGFLLNTTLPGSEEDVPTPSLSSQTQGAAIMRYTEALGYIEERGMFSTPVGSPQDMVTASLKAYLSQKRSLLGFFVSRRIRKIQGGRKPTARRDWSGYPKTAGRKCYLLSPPQRPSCCGRNTAGQ